MYFSIRFLLGLVCLGLGGIPPAQTAFADNPVSFGSLLERLVDLDTVYEKPVSRASMVSSFDRTKGNRDASGYLRKEGDWFVIAEQQGPGAIVRFWTAKPKGLIRIYLDDGGSPVIQQNLSDLFSGKVAPFQKPFVYQASADGTNWSYIPIPFAKFCKVLVSEQNYYQIEFASFPQDTEVKSFQYPPSASDKKKMGTIGKEFTPSTSPPIKQGKNLAKYDMDTTIPAGETIRLASFAGPAILRGIRLNWGKASANASRDLLVKIFWDEEPDPSVVVPAHDFFGSRVQTRILGREKGGTRYCYFPMPFQSSMRMYLQNGHTRLDCKIDASLYIEEKADLPDPLRTFHAFWQRNSDTEPVKVSVGNNPSNPPCDPNENYTALATEGHGHLVGMTLYRSASPHSDTMIFVDGSQWPPSIVGTGMEGFFDMAHEAQTVDWPLIGGLKDFEEVNCLTRLFLPNPITFAEGISVTLEHGPSNMLRKDIASTIYWYQEEPHMPYPWILPPRARHFRQAIYPQPIYHYQDDVAIPHNPMVEAENVSIEVLRGHFEPRDMRPHGPNWSHNQVIDFKGFNQGARIRFQHPRLPYSGWYKFDTSLSTLPDGGISDVEINGQTILTDVLHYSEEPASKRLLSRRQVFLHASDIPKIDFLVHDKQAKSTGYSIGVDAFALYANPISPDRLAVLGPFGLPGDLERREARWIESTDGDSLLLGYDYTNEGRPPGKLIEPSGEETGGFPVGELVQAREMSEALCFVSWTVHIERAGIYRMDIGPSSISPFLLRKVGSRIKALKRSLLVNEIPVAGKSTVYFDPETQQFLPSRFRVPLARGQNEIGWLLRCEPDTTIHVELYGARKN